jgi:hypothetical protein
MSSSDNEEIIEIKLKKNIDNENLSQNDTDLQQVIDSTNEINISATPSNESTPLSSTSSNSTSTTNNLIDYKPEFCSSNSSLNTSFYEMNQVIDITKNEYFTKTSLNSPNKFINQKIQLDLFLNNTDNEHTCENLRRSVRLAQLYNNNKLNTIELTEPSTLLTEYNENNLFDHQNGSGLIDCETNNDILLSTALSIDTSESFLKSIDSITNTTATTSTTSTNDLCNGDNFLNIDQQQQQFLSNSFGHYTNQDHELNELLEKNFNSFESDLLQTHGLNRIQYNLISNYDDQNEFTLLRPSNSLIGQHDFLNISNTKHDVSIGTDLSISRDIRCKFVVVVVVNIYVF